MRRLVFTLLMLFYCAASFGEEVIFINIPENTETSLVMNSIVRAAQHRKWTIKEEGKDKIIITLDHHNDMSKLTFTPNTMRSCKAALNKIIVTG